MSKLAAVRTGQPAQGIGTVPDFPASLVPPDPSLPDTEGNGFDHPPSPLSPASSPPPVNPRSPFSAPAATMAAAWLSLSATEMEVRRYFRSVTVPSGLELLAKMRRQCDMAASEIQQRIDDGNTERCSGCGKTLDEVHKSGWLMVGSDVDAETGVPMPYRYCGPQCIRARNREKMLPPELRDKKRFDGEEMGDVK